MEFDTYALTRSIRFLHTHTYTTFIHQKPVEKREWKKLNLTKLRVLTQYNKQYHYNFSIFCTIGIACYLISVIFHEKFSSRFICGFLRSPAIWEQRRTAAWTAQVWKRYLNLGGNVLLQRAAYACQFQFADGIRSPSIDLLTGAAQIRCASVNY